MLWCRPQPRSRYFAKVGKLYTVDFGQAAIRSRQANFCNPRVDHVAADIRREPPEINVDNVIWGVAIEHFTEMDFDATLIAAKFIFGQKAFCLGAPQ